MTAAAPSTRDRFAAWSRHVVAWLRRWFRRLLVLGIAGVAATWSFVTLNNLAQFLGFGPLSWMFPLCIDAMAALGMDYWMTRSPAWRAGRVMALTAIGVSIAGNVSDWLLRGVSPLAALFGVIPPAALGAVLGIAHRNAAGTAQLAEWLKAEADYKAQQDQEADQKRAARESRRVAKRPTEPRPVIESRTVTEPLHLEPAQPPRGDDTRLIAEIQKITNRTGVVPTKRAVMDQFGVGSGRALRLTKTVRETVTTETVETDEEASA
jgi:hypothetical protein